MQKNDRKHRGEFFRSISMISQIGLMIVACVLVGVLIGWFLDNRLGTGPWLLLVFSLAGMAAAFKAIFDFVNRK